MSRAMKQAWWAPWAGLLVLAQLVMVPAMGASSEDGEAKAAGVVISLVGAVVLAVGLWKRPYARTAGNALVVVGALFAAFWFWTLVLPVVAALVILGVVSSEVRDPMAAANVP